jgi:hypothetical protein
MSTYDFSSILVIQLTIKCYFFPLFGPVDCYVTIPSFNMAVITRSQAKLLTVSTFEIWTVTSPHFIGLQDSTFCFPLHDDFTKFFLQHFVSR